MVSPVADRDSRDQEKKGDHNDPVRLKEIARNDGCMGSRCISESWIGI
jgi:hypothetical protein